MRSETADNERWYKVTADDFRGLLAGEVDPCELADTLLAGIPPGERVPEELVGLESEMSPALEVAGYALTTAGMVDGVSAEGDMAATALRRLAEELCGDHPDVDALAVIGAPLDGLIRKVWDDWEQKGRRA